MVRAENGAGWELCALEGSRWLHRRTLTVREQTKQAEGSKSVGMLTHDTFKQAPQPHCQLLKGSNTTAAAHGQPSIDKWPGLTTCTSHTHSAD